MRATFRCISIPLVQQIVTTQSKEPAVKLPGFLSVPSIPPPLHWGYDEPEILLPSIQIFVPQALMRDTTDIHVVVTFLKPREDMCRFSLGGFHQTVSRFCDSRPLLDFPTGKNAARGPTQSITGRNSCLLPASVGLHLIGALVCNAHRMRQPTPNLLGWNWLAIFV